MMIRNNFRVVLDKHLQDKNERVSFRRLQDEIGLDRRIISDWYSDSVKYFDRDTLSTLCAYLQCQPGDILEYQPDGGDQ